MIAILYIICYNNSMKNYSSNLIKQLYHCYYQSNIALSPTETKKFKLHFHEYYEILILTQGNIQVVIQDTTYQLSANELIVIPPNTYHYIIPDKTIYQRIVLHFIIHEEKISALEEKKYYPTLSPEFSHILSSFTGRFIYYYENFSQKDFDMLSTGLTTELILILCNAPTQSSRNFSQNNSFITKIIQYIDEHIQEQITLNDLSKHFYLSANYISILFKKEMHIPIITYIKEKKLTLINIRLKDGTSLKTLAKEYGFSSYSNFFKLYKKAFGGAPSNNREKKSK